MKKITLAIGIVASLLNGAFAQTKKDSNYESRKLKLDEINFVTSYYQQDGNNSAITGGVGTEYLWDIANSLDVRFSKKDEMGKVHSLALDLNIDHYSSASSDQIDPLTVSSASKTDTHFYPSISYSVKDDITRTTKGLSLNYSTEWDYKSYGVNFNFAKASADNNREFSVKANAFFDKWMAILPPELRPANYPSGAEHDQAGISYKSRNSYSVAFSLSQVINKRLQVMATIEPSYQEGLLSTPFHRVYFTNGNHTVEKLPGTRFKLPIGFRASYFLGDKVIIKGFYRYYTDNWGMKAHTVNLEVPYKITSFFSVSPFYRFNTQTAVKYFAPYQQHVATESYYTCDYDISNFNSNFMGSGIRIAPPNGVLGMKYIQSLELRYGHYTRSNGMVSNIITMALKIK